MKEEFESLILFHSKKEDGNMAKKYGETADINRQKFISKIGLNINQFLFMQPDNSDKIVELKEDVLKEKNLYYKLIEADAIVSRYPNVYIYLNFADCLPFTIYDKKLKIFAFAHLGWRSTYLNLHQKLFQLFVEQYHSSIQDLSIHIGPCIKKESYLLPNPGQKEDDAWKFYVSYVKDDLYAIDLRGYVVDFFKKNGFYNHQIFVSDIDTGSNLEYFSHYRSTHTNEKEGRFFYGVGMLEKE
ncbi:MAG: polyphenol oxidase family protein [Bacilli bacterium]|nr:polyphenol oxidase family protein [Bacilli bacterium]